MRGDTSPYNDPTSIRSNIEFAFGTMSRADDVLGTRRLQRFCNAVSRILFHVEPSLDGLNSIKLEGAEGADIATLLISMATELETGWNVLRLANLPAVHRQGRVASEFISIVALSCISRKELVDLPSKRAPVSRALRQNPGMSVIDLYEPMPLAPDDPSRTQPTLLATQFFKSFLYAGEHVLMIPKETINSFGEYRRFVQHPASHGSSDVVADHFYGFGATTKKAGAYLPKIRHPYLRFEADELLGLSELLADILDWIVYNYLSRQKDA